MWKVVQIVGGAIKAVKAVKSFAEGAGSIPPESEPFAGKGHITIGKHVFGLNGAFKKGEATFVITKNDVEDPDKPQPTTSTE